MNKRTNALIFIAVLFCIMQSSVYLIATQAGQQAYTASATQFKLTNVELAPLATLLQLIDQSAPQAKRSEDFKFYKKEAKKNIVELDQQLTTLRSKEAFTKKESKQYNTLLNGIKNTQKLLTPQLLSAETRLDKVSSYKTRERLRTLAKTVSEQHTAHYKPLEKLESLMRQIGFLLSPQFYIVKGFIRQLKHLRYGGKDSIAELVKGKQFKQAAEASLGAAGALLFVHYIVSKQRGENPLEGIKKGFRRLSRQTGLARLLNRDKKKEEDAATFDDLVGLDSVVKKMRKIIEQSKSNVARKRAKKLNINLPSGYLLAGPPGVGKTLTAKAFANEFGANFHYASAASLVSVYVGTGARAIRKLFAAAQEQTPSVIFIDEIDAIGLDRTSPSSRGTREYTNTLNELLTKMDGFKKRGDIIVFAATNRLDELDSALKDRFSQVIKFELPNETTKAKILAHYLKKYPFKSGIDKDELSRKLAHGYITPSFPPRTLAIMLEAAARHAFEDDRDYINVDDIFVAVNEQRISKNLPELTREQYDETLPIVPINPDEQPPPYVD